MPPAVPPALAAVAARLRCPACGAPLAPAEGALGCAAGHRFDLARQGYVALPEPGRRLPPGDGPAMVEARSAFLGAGHFAPLATALDAATGPLEPGALAVDLGAGPGHHLAGLLDARPGVLGLALDSSRAAVRRAARAHPRLAAVACDVWSALPLADGAAAVVLDVFAPRHGAEIARVLAPDGTLVVVTPAPEHLGELAGPLGLLGVDAAKAERLDAALAPHLLLLDERPLRFTMRLGHDAAAALALMGPSGHHVDAATIGARVRTLPPELEVTASVVVGRYRRRR